MDRSQRNNRDAFVEEDEVDQYMHGYCMFMAAALHHQYGFPVGLLSVTHQDNIERLSHAWVVLPNGKCLDIQGEQTLRQVTIFREDAVESDGLKFQIHKNTTL